MRSTVEIPDGRQSDSGRILEDPRSSSALPSPDGVIRSKSPSPQVHCSETPIGLIVPSGFSSDTYTDSQDRHTATIRVPDSDLLIEYGNGPDGHHHCSKVIWCSSSAVILPRVNTDGVTWFESASLSSARNVPIAETQAHGLHRRRRLSSSPETRLQIPSRLETIRTRCPLEGP